MDKEALICDFAETYHIFDFSTLPLRTMAILAVGLRDSSRIKMKIAGINGTPEEILLAYAVDNLRLLAYSKTKDAEDNINYPEPIVTKFFNNGISAIEKDKTHESFKDPEEFERYRQELIERG